MDLGGRGGVYSCSCSYFNLYIFFVLGTWGYFVLTDFFSLQLLVLGAIPTLVKLAVEDRDEGVRRKAIYALSSEVRNYQPGVDAAVKALPERMRWEGGVDASDMSAVDSFMDKLRQSQKSGES